MRRLLAALACLLPALAGAAEPGWVVPFRAYVNAPAYLNEMGRSIARLETRLAPQCVQVLKGMRRQELRIITEPSFEPGLPIPTGGQWREQVRIDRCGEPALHNVLVTAGEGASPFMTVLLPGSSKADGRLQVKATPAVFAIAGARLEGDCRSSARHIVDTQFRRWLGSTGDAPLADRLWREIWTVRICGRDVRVQVDFAPDGQGGYTHAVDIAP
ncbi:hypothetical protein [Minwuia thermotolerans]|uniref:Uncharacterized protein n=2 Tax=Minwuia thermotolerans TaxID=2056226 RepID=A0A2M9G655_9PROT|nr:hypothetical protein [Minwuia thermotolerans]PJK31190.1 hypothetical protein CVT23_02865 [Minwuia thermotolerans]